ncbi:mobilisation protein (MobC) [Lentzea waywayandensis]|uniref:Mobilisation protein (MobC) n=2 Tax=Lentzea waywayandensis TaxID=84724 RepID=A0A1I6ER37_9PSEU|nr:mobilisation protein (MobC) [Lentzea waywayandensis]
MQVQTELQQLRRASVLHGNNLNQLAAAANTTGEVGLASSRVIANIDRIVAQLDERLSAVDALLARIVDRFEST